MEIKKLTFEELEEIKTLKANHDKLNFEIGQLEVQKRLIEEELEKIKINQNYAFLDLKKLKETEQFLAEKLNEKYGVGVIDINTGEIKPI